MTFGQQETLDKCVFCTSDFQTWYCIEPNSPRRGEFAFICACKMVITNWLPGFGGIVVALLLGNEELSFVMTSSRFTDHKACNTKSKNLCYEVIALTDHKAHNTNN